MVCVQERRLLWARFLVRRLCWSNVSLWPKPAITTQNYSDWLHVNRLQETNLLISEMRSKHRDNHARKHRLRAIKPSWALPPPARRSEGLRGPRTSSSSQSKTPEASPSNPRPHLLVHPASGTDREEKRAEGLFFSLVTNNNQYHMFTKQGPHQLWEVLNDQQL